jgi:hypothetical protein
MIYRLHGQGSIRRRGQPGDLPLESFKDGLSATYVALKTFKLLVCCSSTTYTLVNIYR